jgi:hypothetical protein
MKRLLLIASALTLAGTASLLAQAATTTVEPAKTDTAPVDSPMVRAAKATLKGKKKKSIVIDDAYLKSNSRGRITEVKTAVPMPKVPPPAKQPAPATVTVAQAAQRETEKIANEQKLKNLRAEQARLATEMEDPNGGEMNDPERAAKRMKEIEEEIQKMNHEPGRRP